MLSHFPYIHRRGLLPIIIDSSIRIDFAEDWDISLAHRQYAQIVRSSVFDIHENLLKIAIEYYDALKDKYKSDLEIASNELRRKGKSIAAEFYKDCKESVDMGFFDSLQPVIAHCLTKVLEDSQVHKLLFLQAA